MKDNEKQIEEMAKDLKEVETDVGHILVNETFSYVKEHKKYNPKKDFFNAHTKTFEELTAEEMFKKGYLKLPKDSVVLSKEEYEILTKDIEHPTDEVLKKLVVGKNILTEQVIEKTRKETAEKILRMLYTSMPKTNIVVEIKKQFGVEIK